MEQETTDQSGITEPETIAHLVPRVACAGADADAARDAHRAAVARLLDSIAALMAPALRYIAAKIVVRESDTAGRNGCNRVHRVQRASVRGVLVLDTFNQEHDATGNRGAFGGRRLYLTEHGDWLLLRRHGSWSQWQGEANTWEAQQDRFEDATLLLGAWPIVDRIDDVLEALESTLADAVERLPAAATARRDAARRCEAIRGALEAAREAGR